MTGVFVLGTDVTERKAAEAALAQSEERLRLARDAAALGIHDYDITSGAVEWDARTRALWGVEPDEPITYDVFMAGLHPEDRAATQAAVDRALEACGDDLYCAVYRVINRKDRQDPLGAGDRTGHFQRRAPDATGGHRAGHHRTEAGMKRRCATSIGARTSSWPRWRTSCAIRWRRCATPWR